MLLFRLAHCKTNLLEDLIDPVVVNAVSFRSENFAYIARIGSVHFVKLNDFIFNLPVWTTILLIQYKLYKV